ncbi:MAG: extracellular solute-binding protein [Patescibacteria group bacterium]
MNRFQIIIIAGSIFVAVVALGFFAISGNNSGGGVTGGSLKIWGTESTSALEPLFEKYERQTKTSIEYKEIKKSSFNSEVIEALASSDGPDAVITDIDWIAENKNKLASPITQANMIATFKDTYVDFIGSSLVSKKPGKVGEKPEEIIIGYPLWVDPIVLYWNKDIFNAEPIALPPNDWDEFIKISNKLRRTDAGGFIERAGAALGRAKNIPLHRQILSLLTLQRGANQQTSLFNSTETRKHLESSLRFYTDFVNPDRYYTWNASLPEPRDYFATGKLGMMLDYMSASESISKKNSHLSFGIIRTPQPTASEVPIHAANIIGISVFKVSKKTPAAFTFATWFSEIDAGRDLAVSQNVAPARRDLLRDKLIVARPLFQIIKEESLNARSLQDPYPVESADIIFDMIESVADGQQTISEAISEAVKKMERIEISNNQ